METTGKWMENCIGSASLLILIAQKNPGNMPGTKYGSIYGLPCVYEEYKSMIQANLRKYHESGIFEADGGQKKKKIPHTGY